MTEKVAEIVLKKMLDFGTTLLCENIERLNKDDPKDWDSTRTLLQELIAEGEPFQQTFFRSCTRLIQLEHKIETCKPFDWDAKQAFTTKRDELIQDFTKYLLNNFIQMLKFPDKSIRDKIRRAVSR